MVRRTTLDNLILGFTLLGIGVFLYLSLYLQTTSLKSLDSVFLMAAICGSIWLYLDFFFKQNGWRSYCIIGIFCLLIFLSFNLLFSNLLMSYLAPLLLVWLAGCIHFLWYLSLTKNRFHAITTFSLYVWLPLCIVIVKHFWFLNEVNHPLVYDEFLMAIDGTLGFYPSLVIGRLIRSLPDGLNEILKLIYLGLPLVFIFVYIKLQEIDKRFIGPFVIEIFLIGVLGFALYNIIAGCGSQFAFSSTWPDHLPQSFLQEKPQLIYCATEYPRNCLPSLHTSWSICLLRRAWLCDPLTKIVTSIIAFATFIAMFGIGAHYLVDLVVGFAFANFMGGLTRAPLLGRNKAPWQAMIIGGLLCISWYLLILYGIAFLQLSKYLSWLFYSTSILLSIYLELNLYRAKDFSSAPMGVLKLT